MEQFEHFVQSKWYAGAFCARTELKSLIYLNVDFAIFKKSSSTVFITIKYMNNMMMKFKNSKSDIGRPDFSFRAFQY